MAVKDLRKKNLLQCGRWPQLVLVLVVALCLTSQCSTAPSTTPDPNVLKFDCAESSHIEADRSIFKCQELKEEGIGYGCYKDPQQGDDRPSYRQCSKKCGDGQPITSNTFPAYLDCNSICPSHLIKYCQIEPTTTTATTTTPSTTPSKAPFSQTTTSPPLPFGWIAFIAVVVVVLVGLVVFILVWCYRKRKSAKKAKKAADVEVRKKEIEMTDTTGKGVSTKAETDTTVPQHDEMIPVQASNDPRNANPQSPPSSPGGTGGNGQSPSLPPQCANGIDSAGNDQRFRYPSQDATGTNEDSEPGVQDPLLSGTNHSPANSSSSS